MPEWGLHHLILIRNIFPPPPLPPPSLNLLKDFVENII